MYMCIVSNTYHIGKVCIEYISVAGHIVPALLQSCFSIVSTKKSTVLKLIPCLAEKIKLEPIYALVGRRFCLELSRIHKNDHNTLNIHIFLCINECKK